MPGGSVPLTEPVPPSPQAPITRASGATLSHAHEKPDHCSKWRSCRRS
jgi:hypothetical protein